MPAAAVRYETIDAVARITLDRPERANALTQGMLEEIGQAPDRAEGDAAESGEGGHSHFGPSTVIHAAAGGARRRPCATQARNHTARRSGAPEDSFCRFEA
jgi:hypothetical protein